MKAVPPLNTNFNVTKSEAAKLWSSALPLDESRENYLRSDRIRRSKNGNWVVRLNIRHDAAKVGHLATREFQLLSRLGLDIVSYAHIPLSARKLITISPWVPDISEATQQQYDREAKPVWADYYEIAQRQPSEPYLSSELSLPPNHSVQQGSHKPFLHVIDPILHTAGPSLARYMVKQLSM
jgi:hypothetical protein